MMIYITALVLFSVSVFMVAVSIYAHEQKEENMLRLSLALIFLLAAIVISGISPAYGENSEYKKVDGYDNLYRLTSSTFTYTAWNGVTRTERGGIAHKAIGHSTSSGKWIAMLSNRHVEGQSDEHGKYWIAPVDMSEDWKFTGLMAYHVDLWNWVNADDFIAMIGNTVTSGTVRSRDRIDLAPIGQLERSPYLYKQGKLVRGNHMLVRNDRPSYNDVFIPVQFSPWRVGSPYVIPWEMVDDAPSVPGYSGYHDAEYRDDGKWYFLPPQGLIEPGGWFLVERDGSGMERMTTSSLTAENRYWGHPDFSDDGRYVVYSDANKNGPVLWSVYDTVNREIVWSRETSDVGPVHHNFYFGDSMICKSGPYGTITVADWKKDKVFDPVHLEPNLVDGKYKNYSHYARPFMDDKYVYFHSNHYHPDGDGVDLFRFRWLDDLVVGPEQAGIPITTSATLRTLIIELDWPEEIPPPEIKFNVR